MNIETHSERRDGEPDAIPVSHPQLPLTRLVASGLQLPPVPPVVVAPAGPGPAPVTVVQTLQLLNVQPGEDKVTGASHGLVLWSHHILGGVDSKSREGS